ncbi:MAG: cytochrome C [Nitrospira sp. CG24C]|nr:MAG: cytochrome C [Nitrospira sp. CG24C]
MVLGFASRVALASVLSPTWCSLSAESTCSQPSLSRQLHFRNTSKVIFRRFIIGIAFICTWNIGYAWADSLESALMPGQVIQGHAKWEEDCAKCHKRFDKAAQTRLCQDCHKDIREDIDRKQRFHGRLKEQRECNACHTDHKGRGENIAPINESTFDHRQTNFALNGIHADPRRAECKACHKPKVKYRDTPSDCLTCHKKDDYHKGIFDSKCETCHSDKAWKTSSFNHSKDTKYPLLGKHKAAKCESCHTVPVAKEKTPTTCYACHKKDDKHKGTLDRTCETCHTEKDWKDTPSFNHDKTKFPLQGKHIETKCKACHPDQRYKPTPVDCYSCHKKDDYHKSVFGEKCETCHSGKDWKTSPFDHDKDTKYLLLGKHKTAKCESCHTVPAAKEKTPTTCYACHKKDDAHKGALGRACEQCHTEKEWKDVHLFDHNKTTFPLLGKHEKVACKDCHADQRYKPTPLDCYSCHKKDDKHKGDYGEKCQVCHTDRTWKEITFDHNRDTKYSLNGKHKTTKCETCHKGHLFKEKTPTDCYACHKKDDKHNGTYGENCGDCHVEKNWKELLFDHDRHTKYPLRGKHIGLACETCHKGHLFKEKTPTDCYACHKKDDKHNGQEGKQCESCHRESSWKTVTFDHNKSRFLLRGQHGIIDCKKCHTTLLFKNISLDCIGCHEKEDVHKRRLGKQCESCHTARDWKLWDFDHNLRTKFLLDGAHKKLDCYDCHKKPMEGKVVAPTVCIGCHRRDDKHDGGLGPQCDRCHNTSSWKTIKAGSGAFRNR